MNVRNVAAAVCFPLAAWQVWITTVPNYHLQHLFIYAAIPFVLWAWYRGWWTLREVESILRPALPWLILFLCLHFASSWITAVTMDTTAPCKAAALGSGKLLAQWPLIGVFALLGLILTQEPKSRRTLLYGALGTLCLVFFIFCVQAVFVYCRSPHGLDYNIEPFPTNKIQIWLIRHLHPVIKTIASVLEARWVGGVYDFYHNEAYSLILPRINCIFEEASMLANHTGVVFIPLSIGLLALARRLHSTLCMWAAWSIFVASCLMLALCRSTTGQILLFPACTLWICMLLRDVSAKRISIAVVGIALCLGIAMFLVPQGQTSLVTRLTTGYAQSSSPRAVVTRGTLEIIKEHPLLGTGREAYLPLLYDSKPYQANITHVELQYWKKLGTGECSALLAFTARYGIPVTLVVIFFFIRLYRRLWNLRRAFPESRALAFATPACAAWGVMTFVTLLGSYDPRNALMLLPLCIFWGITAQYANNKLADSTENQLL